MDIEQKDIGESKMLERGEFVANGYKFKVKPIYLGEESDYLDDVTYVLYPRRKDGEEITDKDLSIYAMGLFKADNQQALGFFQKLKRWFVKTFIHNHEYYSDNPNVVGLVKWIEKKVYYKNRPIHFYDLERKFGLSKAEIVKLLGYFQELSGF